MAAPEPRAHAIETSAPEPSQGRPASVSPGPLVTRRSRRIAKRAVDIVVSGTLLIALLPVNGLVALAILIDSGTPILYRSRRVGRGGREFGMVKFRKMRDDISGPPLTTAHDPRYTRIGPWLTRTKLDELPQLWNVLVGQMSLVGPRPEDPQFVAERSEDYETILLVRQGITGLSQLAFYDEAELLDREDPVADYRERIWPAKIALDRLYISQANLRWDLRIIAWSVWCWALRRPVAVDRESGALSARRRGA